MFPGCFSIGCKFGGTICVSQPSWDHVVRGVRVGPQVPLPPPIPLLPPAAGKLCVQITAGAIQLAKSRLVEVVEGRFDVDFSGVNPEFRDEYVREQLDKMAKAAQQVEADYFVAGEILAVANQSQVDESQVLVQPADALYREVGHGDVNEESHDKVIVSETSVNVSMEVHLSEEICKANLDSGSSVEDKSYSVNNKKVKLSENVTSGCCDALEQQPSSPELPHKLPARSMQEGNMSDEVRDGVHTHMFGVNFVMWFDLSIEGKSAIIDPVEQDCGGRLEFGFSE